MQIIQFVMIFLKLLNYVCGTGVWGRFWSYNKLWNISFAKSCFACREHSHLFTRTLTKARRLLWIFLWSKSRNWNFLCSFAFLKRFRIRKKHFFQFISRVKEKQIPKQIPTNIWFGIQKAYLFIDFSCLQNSVETTYRKNAISKLRTNFKSL